MTRLDDNYLQLKSDDEVFLKTRHVPFNSVRGFLQTDMPSPVTLQVLTVLPIASSKTREAKAKQRESTER